ncbi:MAG: GAF domain-containing protein [Chloroflexi bacterium]|nr:GAF domain-containing protein [Chloroflexota bacterium]
MNHEPFAKLDKEPWTHPDKTVLDGTEGDTDSSDSRSPLGVMSWRHWNAKLKSVVQRLRNGNAHAQDPVQTSPLEIDLSSNPESSPTQEWAEQKSVDIADSEQQEFVQALHDTAVSLSGMFDIEKALDRILASIAHLIPCDSVDVMLFENGTARVVRSKVSNLHRNEGSPVSHPLVVDQVPQLRQVIANGQAVVIADTTERPAEIEFEGASWVRSHITVPIQIAKQIIGFVNVDSAIRGMFNPVHANYLQAFADQAAVAIENARLIAESHLRIRELSALNRIQTSINSTLELEWVLRLTMQEAQDLFGVEECSVMLLDEPANELVFQMSLGLPASKKFRLNINRGIAGWVARTGNPALVNNVPVDPRWDPVPDSITGFTTRSILALPLQSRSKTIGVVELINKIEGGFTDADLRLLNSVSNLVAGAIENARLFGELNKAYQEMAETQSQVIESRNTLRTLFDGIDDRICIVNSDLRVLALNRAAAAESELEPRAGVGKLCYDIMDHLDAPCEQCPVKDTFGTGKSAWVTQSRITKKGAAQELEIRTYPLENSEGAVESVIEIVRDVTEKRKMESTLVQSAKLSAVGELAAGVAHEINNPLTAVYGNAQMLLKMLDSADSRYEMVQLIERAGLRASKVVRNLLDFSRREDYQFEPTDINSTIEDSLSLILHQLHRSTIQVTQTMQPDLPLVRASSSHLQTVWTNLLLNARDAIGEKKNGTIHITTQLAEDGKFIQILFADDGPGIAEKDLPKIFDPFFTTKPQGRGTGLGLYVSHLIIAHHNGTMQVSSEMGKGATFIVSLPVEMASQ